MSPAYLEAGHMMCIRPVMRETFKLEVARFMDDTKNSQGKTGNS
jgi:hypothetical protein